MGYGKMMFPWIYGAELVLAGGCVRDTLLGLPFKDRDFVIITSRTYQDICEAINLMPDSRVYLAKPEFMTIRCRILGQDVDITWPRTESGYADGRHPSDVQVASSLSEDAHRRDFTVNALYMNSNGDILDYVGGQVDLAERILRTPTDPYVTFKDDYLRIARLIRFAVTKGFTVERKTLLAAAESVQYMFDVPFERIKDELNRAMIVSPERTFKWLTLFGLYDLLESKGLHFQLTAKEF